MEWLCFTVTIWNEGSLQEGVTFKKNWCCSLISDYISICNSLITFWLCCHFEGFLTFWICLSQSAAKMIKETMDKKFGSSWHVVIGEGFGFEITHEVKNLLYMFFGGSLAICVWKCSWRIRHKNRSFNFLPSTQDVLLQSLAQERVFGWALYHLGCQEVSSLLTGNQRDLQ